MNDFEVHPIGTAQRLAELERDAARYRWLRNDSESAADWAPMAFCCAAFETPHWRDAVTGEHLDAAIDAAMGEAK